MSDQSRRNFLKRSSVGAAAVGAAALVPAFPAAAQAAESHDSAHDSGPAHDGSFTVWVKDAASGQVAVLVGEAEHVYQDKALAKRLARLAARANAAR